VRLTGNIFFQVHHQQSKIQLKPNSKNSQFIMKHIFFSVLFLFSITANAQVGIGPLRPTARRNWKSIQQQGAF